jgi:hypothetical protein
MMFRKAATFFSVLVTALILSSSAGAVDFTVGSLNALHLGWGTATNTSNKCAQIKALMATVDILLLQEVMQLSVPCASLGANISTDCSISMLGASSYKEAYCVVFDTNVMTFTGCYAEAPAASFSRPPYAVLMKVKVGSNFKYAWFADIHSVFGKTVKPRQDEATAAGSFFQGLVNRTCSPIKVPAGGMPVIIGGDWNLGVTNKAGTYNAGFLWADPSTNPTTDPSACPTTSPTSLTPTGVPSSPYDHFVITQTTLTGDATCYWTTKTLTKLKWRQDVSDHMAIYWGITFK